MNKITQPKVDQKETTKKIHYGENLIDSIIKGEFGTETIDNKNEMKKEEKTLKEENIKDIVCIEDILKRNQTEIETLKKNNEKIISELSVIKNIKELENREETVRKMDDNIIVENLEEGRMMKEKMMIEIDMIRHDLEVLRELNEQKSTLLFAISRMWKVYIIIGVISGVMLLGSYFDNLLHDRYYMSFFELSLFSIPIIFLLLGYIGFVRAMRERTMMKWKK